jgi:hypothetical protein
MQFQANLEDIDGPITQSNRGFFALDREPGGKDVEKIMKEVFHTNNIQRVESSDIKIGNTVTIKSWIVSTGVHRYRLSVTSIYCIPL